jgi:hypothetical protein
MDHARSQATAQALAQAFLSSGYGRIQVYVNGTSVAIETPGLGASADLGKTASDGRHVSGPNTNPLQEHPHGYERHF